MNIMDQMQEIKRLAGELASDLPTPTQPDWNNAPEWAYYHAFDEDGEEYWYENKPIDLVLSWETRGGEWDIVKELTPRKDWRDTLSKRP